MNIKNKTVIKLSLMSFSATGMIYGFLGLDLGKNNIASVEAHPIISPVYQSNSNGSDPCLQGYRFCDGSAPKPPIPLDADSYAFGYINFQPPTSCLTFGGGGGGNPNPVLPDANPTRESKDNFASTSNTYGVDGLDVDPTPVPTQPCHPYYMQPSEHPPRFAHMRRNSNSGINDYVLGSEFSVMATWPKAQGWLLLDNGQKPYGMHHNEGGLHVVATIQRIDNVANSVRAIGYHNDGRRGRFVPFAYIGDSPGGGDKDKIRRPTTREPITGHNLSALLLLDRNRVCLHCNCPPYHPVIPKVYAAWGGISEFYVVSSFDPVVEIWDGASSTNNSNHASGSYDISMNFHQYYYDDQAYNCYGGCAQLSALAHSDYWGVSRARRFWGRNPGDSGFIERNQHNIYWVISSGGCNNPYYDPAQLGAWEEDPGEYKWNICTGYVDGTPCCNSITPVIRGKNPRGAYQCSGCNLSVNTDHVCGHVWEIDDPDGVVKNHGSLNLKTLNIEFKNENRITGDKYTHPVTITLRSASNPSLFDVELLAIAKRTSSVKEVCQIIDGPDMFAAKLTVEECQAIKELSIDQRALFALFMMRMKDTPNWLSDKFPEDCYLDSAYANAILHSWINCVLTRNLGLEFTRKYWYAHEAYATNVCGPMTMDMNNNNVGRNIAILLPSSVVPSSPGTLYECCLSGVVNMDMFLVWANVENDDDAARVRGENCWNNNNNTIDQVPYEGSCRPITIPLCE